MAQGFWGGVAQGVEKGFARAERNKDRKLKQDTLDYNKAQQKIKTDKSHREAVQKDNELFNKWQGGIYEELSKIAGIPQKIFINKTLEGLRSAPNVTDLAGRRIRFLEGYDMLSDKNVGLIKKNSKEVKALTAQLSFEKDSVKREDLKQQTEFMLIGILAAYEEAGAPPPPGMAEAFAQIGKPRPELEALKNKAAKEFYHAGQLKSLDDEISTIQEALKGVGDLPEEGQKIARNRYVKPRVNAYIKQGLKLGMDPDKIRENLQIAGVTNLPPGGEKTKKREIRNDQNGIPRYTDTQKPVFEKVKKENLSALEVNREIVKLQDKKARLKRYINKPDALTQILAVLAKDSPEMAEALKGGKVDISQVLSSYDSLIESYKNELPKGKSNSTNNDPLGLR